MKKQGRNFIVLVAVLAVLAVLYICLTQFNKRQQENLAGQTEGEVLVDIAKDDIIRISYVHEGETYTFDKTDVSIEGAQDGAGTEPSPEDGKAEGEQPGSEAGDGAGAAADQAESRWVYADDPTLNIIQSRLDVMAGRLNSVIAQNIFVDVTDLEQYGLAEPSNVLHWETAEASYTFNVGDYNSFGNVYYICEPGTDIVYAVNASMGTGFDYSLEDLTEKEAEESEAAGS